MKFLLYIVGFFTYALVAQLVGIMLAKSDPTTPESDLLMGLISGLWPVGIPVLLMFALSRWVLYKIGIK